MEDLNIGADFQHMTFVDDSIDDRGDTASVCSSLSAGLASSKFNTSILGSNLRAFCLWLCWIYKAFAMLTCFNSM